MNNKDDDSSSSDYEVEQFVRPDRIKRSINDDSADLLGNFDDAKRKEIMEGHNPHSNEEQHIDDDDDDNETEDDDDDGDNEKEVDADTNETVEGEAAENTITLNGKTAKLLSKTQLDVLLRGVSKANRHVLYVTNLNFETTKEDLFTHFEVAGNVKSIRLPKKRRGGCAFVEFSDLEGYQRGFTLHNTELRGRQIKVQYSEAGKKKSANKKNIIKQKNRKLAQMRNELKTFTKSGKFYDKSIKKEKAAEAVARKRWRKKPAIRKG